MTPILCYFLPFCKNILCPLQTPPTRSTIKTQREPGMQCSKVPGRTQQNTMILRAISIGLSVAMLLGLAGWWLSYYGLGRYEVPMLMTMVTLNGFPLVVSIVISILSRHPLSHIFSATASCLYGLSYVVFWVGLFNGWWSLGFFTLAYGILVTPFFLPFWITAIVVEICHCIKKTDP